MKRFISTVVLLAVALLSLSACGSSSSSKPVYSAVDALSNGETLSGGESVIVAENSNLSLAVEPETGAFSLLNKANGFSWNSVPADLDSDPVAKPAVRNMMRGQLSLECGDVLNHIVSTYNSQVDSVMEGGLTVTRNGDKGFIATYYFPAIAVTVPVRYTLYEDYLEAEIVVGEIVEEGDYQVLSTGLLSSFGAGSQSEEGYLVVPDGSGAVIEFNNGKRTYNNFSIPIYGPDLSLTDKTVSGYSKAYMPIFGINKGENGMLAVISRGDAHASVNASVSGKTSGYNTVYPSFVLRDSKTVSIDRHSGVVENAGNSFIMFDTHPQTLNSVAVQYYPLTGADADYSGMARRYGRILADGESRKESEKPSLFLDIYGSINAEQRRLFTTVLKPVDLTTFEEAGEMVSALADGGVESFRVQYKNWSGSSVNGKYTKKFDPLSSLGGKKGLSKLSTVLEENNAKLYLATDIQQFKSGANALGLLPTVREIDNAPLLLSRVRRDNYEPDIESTKYGFVSAYNLPKQMDKLLSTLPDSYNLSLWGTEVYTDFGSNYSKRQQSVAYLCEAAAKLKNGAADSPNAFMLSSVDTAFSLGGQFGRYDVEDYGIPFYQIATAGILSSSLEPINLSSDKQTAFLRSMEYGCGLMFTLVARDDIVAAETKENALYSCSASKWQDEILEKYKAANAVYDRIGSRLFRHERLSYGVYKSVFEKGSLITNYTEQPFIYEGTTVEPNSYSVVA